MKNQNRESGFALLEAMAGALVLVLLIFVGSKAFKNVISNHKESAQLKALTDAVTQTAENLSSLSVATLTAASSNYLEWSQPKIVGLGPNQFRYRIVPNPMVSGVKDTTVVGLEVETGLSSGGGFTASRSFATLIAPHVNSKDGLGKVSTAKEREAEAAFHSGLESQIAALSKEVVGENQARLNSFACYDKGQCCDFMKEFFKDPNIRPKDGLKEKCLYRCALGGAVTMNDWKGACGIDMCALAPWKTKEQCCAAISAGECNPGSACANVCVSCVGEDGSTCGPPICDGMQWNDFFDCKNQSFCDGTPLPDGVVAGWGNVKSLCKTATCAAVGSECYQKVWTCCQDYWRPKALGDKVDPKAEICSQISQQSECCNLDVKVGGWELYCGGDGTVVSALNIGDGQWYCGLNGPNWDKYCAYQKGCSVTYRPSGAQDRGCRQWGGAYLADPYVQTKNGQIFVPPPADPVVVATPPATVPVSTTPSGSTPKTIPDVPVPVRNPSERHGNKFGSFGGQE